MTAESIPITQSVESKFQTGEVITIVGGHFIHDTYTAFVAPLLPVIIDKMSLSLTAAGSLNALMQFPAILNPLIGYLADKVSLRYFVILAPAVTGTLISALGLAPNYFTLALLLFITGISVAAFHAPAPAMIGQVSGRQVGKGMSFFMAGGELGRTVGPLIAVWAVTTWSLDGIYRFVVLGWAASGILFWRLSRVPARVERSGNLRALLAASGRIFIPLILINFFRNFLADSLATYLPIFMSMEGANLWVAGGALSILELAGVAGALVSGTLSDRLGRKPILLGVTVLSSGLMLAFLNTSGWLLVPVLVLLGFSAFSPAPVMLAIVQDYFPNNRAVGNGLFMLISFLLRPISILAIGFAGEHLGLRTAYFWSALLTLLAIPAILFLPTTGLKESR